MSIVKVILLSSDIPPPHQLDELTSCLINYCNIVPSGIVVFVPSYGFLDTLMARWRETQAITRIEAKKKVRLLAFPCNNDFAMLIFLFMHSVSLCNRCFLSRKKPSRWTKCCSIMHQL